MFGVIVSHTIKFIVYIAKVIVNFLVFIVLNLMIVIESLEVYSLLSFFYSIARE
jgi:hypothetical protein